jgi:hypothetical protein
MRAALAGSTVMGWVVVERVREGVIDGEVGVGGWVKSKPVEGEKSQKLEEEPITV